uniref:Uncharacterized protein n=1 Tax=Lepeophtheirus salmonis TaxID=72036 RepID=A0A0K2US50_LEPSM
MYTAQKKMEIKLQEKNSKCYLLNRTTS